MSMRTILPALLAGVLFGAGLALSDMINPARILAFLDVAGSWDPTLAFVMGGALIPSAAAYLLTRRMRRPLLEDAFRLPAQRELDSRLLAGATLFGVGWGLVGLCPGPAIAGLALGRWELWLFAAAMLGGMLASATGVARSGTPWRQAAAFVLGLPAGAALVSVFIRSPELEVTSSLPLLVTAGLLVGFGTRLGNGCTSGHGVCGMARLSPRSIAATLTFMAAGFATVFMVRHLVGG